MIRTSVKPRRESIKRRVQETGSLCSKGPGPDSIPKRRCWNAACLYGGRIASLCPHFPGIEELQYLFFSMRDSVRIHWTTEVTATRYFEPPKKRKLLAARRWLRESSMPRRGSQLSVCFKLKGEGVSFLQVVCFPLERADFKWMKPKHFVLPHCFWWVIFFFFSGQILKVSET